MSGNRDQGVDTIRGFAIIVIVVFHSVDQFPQETLAHVCDFMAYKIGLPLFAGVAGFVYAMRPASRKTCMGFLSGKLRRILLPCVTVSTAVYLLQALMPGVNNPSAVGDIWRIYIFRYGQWWFLYSLATVFVILAVLDSLFLMQKFLKWLAILVLAAIIGILVPLNQLHVSGAIYLLPYFVLGIGILRFETRLINKGSAVFASVLFVVILPFHLFVGHMPALDHRMFLTAIQLLTGLCATFLFIAYRKDVPALSCIGHYSYSIYLFHLLGGAVSIRIAKYFVSTTTSPTQFVLHIVLGIFIPILIELILVRNMYLRFLFLGVRLKAKP